MLLNCFSAIFAYILYFTEPLFCCQYPFQFFLYMIAFQDVLFYLPTYRVNSDDRVNRFMIWGYLVFAVTVATLATTFAMLKINKRYQIIKVWHYFIAKMLCTGYFAAMLIKIAIQILHFVKKSMAFAICTKSSENRSTDGFAVCCELGEWQKAIRPFNLHLNQKTYCRGYRKYLCILYYVSFILFF